jgi:pSer/pThr/pTyr-binding forkhead associated (FHA) protein
MLDAGGEMPRLVIRKGTAAGRDHALGGACVVGRDASSADFVLDDHLVSRQHFRVFPEGGAWVLEDLQSTNGTLVNRQRATRHPLVDGDLIRVGATELAFVQKDLLGGAGRGRAKAGDPPVRRRRRRR